MHQRLSAGRLGLSLVVIAGFSFGACSGGTAGQNNPAGSAGAAGAGVAGASGLAGTSAVAGASGSGSSGTQGTAGAAGASGSAGTSAAGAAGAGGSAGSGGAGGASGAAGAAPSEGCGMPAGQALMSYVKVPIMVTGVTAKQAPRDYYVWLPADYDPKRAYPLVFIGPGCGSDGMHGIQIQKASGNNAIVVGLDPSTNVDPEGRQCFDSQSFPDPEVPYFDQTLKEVESKFCVDKSRLFIEGFSSGSWLSNLIGCVDAGTIRAQGNASGCMQGLPPGTCTKPVAYFEAHNDPDPNNSYQCGTQNRDEKIKRNGCTNQTMPYTPVGLTMPAGATIDCVQYVGCMKGYPVIFCTTKGLNPQHNPQDDSSTNLTTAAMWNFWTTLESP
jgi:poly(3-hydroxybutyrate) depolymerase